MRFRSSLVLVLVLAACGNSSAPAPSSAVTTTPATPNATATGGAVTLEWRATQAADEWVDVVLVVAGAPHALGQLSAAAADAEGTPATCSLAENPTPTRVGFTCGRTPAYNFYRAVLAEGELVVTKHSGFDEDPTSEETVEVRRIPSPGTSLVVAPYVAAP